MMSKIKLVSKQVNKAVFDAIDNKPKRAVADFSGTSACIIHSNWSHWPHDIAEKMFGILMLAALKYAI
jgi:hypothetical protein